MGEVEIVGGGGDVIKDFNTSTHRWSTKFMVWILIFQDFTMHPGVGNQSKSTSSSLPQAVSNNPEKSIFNKPIILVNLDKNRRENWIIKKKMESTQIMMQEKLGFFKLFKEAFTIPLKNPHFIIFTILTSIPLFSSLFVYETILQHTLIATAKILLQALPPHLDCDICYDWKNLGFVEKLTEEKVVPTNYLLLVLFYLGILHFLDLISLIAIVDSASTIYAGNKTLNLKDLFQRFIKETRFKGPLITSISVLLLASLILFGLLSLATYIYIASPYVSMMVLFGLLFIALFAKYIEWSAIWNMGIVISILEEKQGEVALWISSYLSRGNKKRGFLLALVFFVWRLGLRLSSLYLRWFVEGNTMVITATHVSLVCLGNVTKWLVFVVYFYNCKKCSRSHSREKNNIDVEESNAAAGGVGGTE